MADETYADEFLRKAAPHVLEMEDRFRDLMAGLRPTVVPTDKARLQDWQDLALEDEEGLLERLNGGNA